MKHTVKEVAERAGVSIATVSRVINDSSVVSPETVERVNAAIKELGYTPNFQARSLKTSRSNAIGVVIPDLAIPFFSTIANSLEISLREKGYFMVISCHHDWAELEKTCLKTLEGMRVDAVVVSSTGYNEDYLQKLNSAGIPTLLLDRRPIRYDLPSVSSDKVDGFYRLTEHLYRLGHRRFAFATSDPKISSNLDRYRGIEKYFMEYGVSFDNLTCYYDTYSEESGYRVAERIMSQTKGSRATAFLAGSSSIATGALRYCKDHDISVPEDISIVGIGNLGIRDLMINSLTHMDDLHNEISRQLTEVLFNLLNGTNETSFPIILPTNIVYGNTSGQAPDEPVI